LWPMCNTNNDYLTTCHFDKETDMIQ
jgi:hypothetical protein